MIYLIDHVLPESYFANNLRALSVDMAVFRDLLRLQLPQLSKHLDYLQAASRDQSTGEARTDRQTDRHTHTHTHTHTHALTHTCAPVLRRWREGITVSRRRKRPAATNERVHMQIDPDLPCDLCLLQV